MLEALQQEVAQLQEKERQLKQIEVFCQQKKEKLLKQYRKVLPPSSTCSETNKDGRRRENGSEKQQYSEVLNLLVQIHDLEEKKQTLTFHVRNTAAEEERCTVSQALKDDHSLVHRAHQMHNQVCTNLSPLERWYMQMLECEEYPAKCGTGGQLPNRKNTERLRLPDRPVYSVAFKQASKKEALMFKGSIRNMSSTRPRQNDPSTTDYQLSFTTRRNGVCVHTLITRQVDEKSCVPLADLGDNMQATASSDSPVTTVDKTTYTFCTDPYVPGVSERGIDSLQHELHPVEFVKEILWPAIDLNFGKV